MSVEKQKLAIEMRDVSKSFGTAVANDKVNLEVRYGEILSLLGENGSGKTTLMNMLSGIYFPDSGHILIKGKEVTIRSPHDALELGIGMVHQHFKLVDVFSATENVMLGLKEKASQKQVEEKITSICDKYGFEVHPDKKVYDMSVAEKQTLEIVKVLYRGADILILDEPTAVLTPQETKKLFAVMRNMKADGKAVIIITHKLNEVLSVSDRVAILRKGVSVGTVDTANATENSLTEMMVGKKIELDIERPTVSDRQLRLAVKHLSVENEYGALVLDDVNFEAYSGEILGIAGISGCGQKELLEAVAGLQKTQSGSSICYTAPGMEAEELLEKTPKQIRECGVALSFVPEDRLGMGLVGSMGMTENMLLRSYSQGRSPFLSMKEPKHLAKKIREELEVVTTGINTPVRKLSGGNVQKVLVGREIANAPNVLMTAYAVRGLDINTSYTIYRLLNEQKKRGVAVVYVGEDLDVLLALSDRILVLCEGKVNGILDARTTTKEEVGLLMTNLRKGGADNE
ncbi:MAG: ABC transporter ATP-binding protein [Lachnospiraceae bacterium]|nr:ABC transporter ATP-binding protein [Agathobacter sp.]MDD6291276.1 ABC transporter ATP-binding protein [Lachnospiraceae bacterium]